MQPILVEMDLKRTSGKGTVSCSHGHFVNLKKARTQQWGNATSPVPNRHVRCPPRVSVLATKNDHCRVRWVTQRSCCRSNNSLCSPDAGSVDNTHWHSFCKTEPAWLRRGQLSRIANHPPGYQPMELTGNPLAPVQQRSNRGFLDRLLIAKDPR
jgi:hypothetical protein